MHSKTRIVNNNTTLQAWGVVLIILCNLLFTYPSVLPFLLPVPSVTVITPLFTGLYTLLLIKRKSLPVYNKLIFQCFVIQLFGWAILAILNRDGIYITRIVFLINAFLSLVCIWNYKGALSLFQKLYMRLIAIVSIGGVIAFILVLINMLQPVLTYENLDGREGIFYGFTCTNAQLANVIRFSGIFDEPGAMAFWAMIALLLNHFSINNKLLEKIVMICIIFTFSMAYYIQIFFYIIFFKIKTLKQTIFIVSILSGIVIGIVHTKDTEFDLYTPTLMRFEMDDDGSLKGDNRSDAALIAKEKFLESPLIGHGPAITTEGSYMADNQYENLATDGLIGTFIMYLPLVVLLFPFNKNVFKALFILALGYIQRPFHQNFTHAFFLYILSYTLIVYNYNSLKLKCTKAVLK